MSTPPKATVTVPANQRHVQIQEMIRASVNQIYANLPTTIPNKRREEMADRIRRVIVTIAQSGARGMEKIKPEQFRAAAVRVAQIGLDPEPILGQVYLIPFGEMLQLIVGYRGYMELAYRTGQVKDFRAGVVYPGEQFIYRTGGSVLLEHQPDLDGDHSNDDIRATYAVCDLVNGGQAHIVLANWQVLQYRSRSSAVRYANRFNQHLKQGESPMETPWDTDKAAMYLKTSVRRLQPWIPQATEHAAAAIRFDYDSDPRERGRELTEDEGTGKSLIVMPETLKPVAREAGMEPEPEPEAQPEPGEAPKPETQTTIGGQQVTVITLSDMSEDERARFIYCLRRTKKLNKAQVVLWLEDQKFTSVQQALGAVEELLLAQEQQEQGEKPSEPPTNGE